MAFVRQKTVGKYRYSYLERRYREGGKVRSESICLGRVGGFDRSIDGYAGEFDDMAQGAAQLAEREAAKADGAREAASDKDAESGAASEGEAEGSDGGADG
jgi:hypothetical protein